MDDIACHKPHPYGVQPSANFLLADGSLRGVRVQGLGALRSLGDGALLEILSLLSSESLCAMCLCSRAFYVYAHHGDLWRDLTLAAFGGDFEYSRGWKDTFARRKCRGKPGVRLTAHQPMRVRGIYSDALFRPWTCSAYTIKPEWLEVDNIERRNNLSVAEFVAQYERRNVPVVVTDVASRWPALHR